MSVVRSPRARNGAKREREGGRKGLKLPLGMVERDRRRITKGWGRETEENEERKYNEGGVIGV